MSSPVLFEKRIEEIVFEDIQNLQARRISEGMYAEYKSDFQTPARISHSIASFANAHGGWYFLGIKAGADNVPEEFNGIDLSTHKKPIEEIRDIAVGNISPIPLFFTRLIETENGRAILVIYIPESTETPHVTKDGRIYRRNGEGSDPVAENDRYTIDKLYEKGKRIDDMVENFCRMQFTVSEAQKNQGWLEIYLMTHPFDKFFIDKFFETDEISGLQAFFKTNLEIYGSLSMSIPFDNVTTSLDSLIFRQTTAKSLMYVTLTFQWFRNGNAKMLIPFNYIDFEHFVGIDYSSSEILKKLKSIPEPGDLSSLRIIDGWNLHTAFLIMLGKYYELLKKSEWKEEIFARYRLFHTWRHVLFFDSPSYISYLDDYGVPICLIDESEIPGRLANNFIRKPMPDDVLSLSGDFALVLECLGFHPMSFGDMLKDGWHTYLKRLPQKKASQLPQKLVGEVLPKE